jgi:hypothetical protein
VSAVTIVTDGSAVAASLATWLETHVSGRSTRVEARDALDVGRVVAARRDARVPERIVALSSDRADAGVDIDGSEAFAVAKGWLLLLPPIDARSRGAAIIRERIATGARGADALIELASLVGGPAATGSRRGRPRGSDPFRGVSLELIVTLLLAPGTGRTERELATAIDRSPFGVHRALEQLMKSGYVTRDKNGALARDADLLRDDLVAAWRARVTLDRAAVAFLAPNRKRAAADVARAARAQGREVRLAGPSAVVGPNASVGDATVFYLDGAAAEILVPAGFRETSVGDVVIWPVPERAVLLAPRPIGSLQATNRVITYADLMMMPTDRQTAAAASVWDEA